MLPKAKLINFFQLFQHHLQSKQIISHPNFHPQISLDFTKNSNAQIKRKIRAQPQNKPISKRNNKDDDENRGGGLLEPIIQDLKGFIERRRPLQNPIPLSLTQSLV